MSTTEARAACAPDAVEFIDEDHRRGGLARRLEHLAHPPGADTHENLDELRSGGREERHVGLSRKRLGQKRLAGAGRAHQQHAMRHFRADLLEPLGLAQEFHQLGHLLFRLVLSRDVGEGDARLFFGRFREPSAEQPTKRPGPVAAAELTRKAPLPPHIESDNQEPRQEIDQN